MQNILIICLKENPEKTYFISTHRVEWLHSNKEVVGLMLTNNEQFKINKEDIEYIDISRMTDKIYRTYLKCLQKCEINKHTFARYKINK